MSTLFRREIVGTWCILFGAVLTLQIAGGAYNAERGHYPDEAAHFMNGVLLREYLAAAGWQDPVSFAEQYYLNYPKIAPLIWPPLFHVLLGLFLLPGWPPHAAALLLVAAVTTWTAWRLFTITSVAASRGAACVIVAIFLWTTTVLDLTSAVMLDMMVAAFALEAAYWLARFMNTGKDRHAMAFGLVAGCCCLTKGSGLCVLLLPPIALALTGRFDLLRRRGLWIAAVTVTLLAAMPTIVSFALDATSGAVIHLVNITDIVARSQFYSAYLWQQLGAVAILLGVLGFARDLVGVYAGRPAREPYLSPVLMALVLGAIAFLVFNPIHVVDGRYMSVAIAPLLGLVPSGVAAAVERLNLRRWNRAAAAALMAAAVLNFISVKPAAHSREPLGYRALVDILEQRDALAGQRLVIVSDEQGEGAFISEVAVRRSIPARATVIRGSKLIATDDWNGAMFRLRFTSSAEILREMEELHVNYVIVDDAAGSRYLPSVQELIAAASDRLRLAYSGSSGARKLTLYELTTPAPGAAKKIRVHVSPLGRVLQEQ